MQRNDLVFGLLIAPLFCHVHLSAIREREKDAASYGSEN